MDGPPLCGRSVARVHSLCARSSDEELEATLSSASSLPTIEGGHPELFKYLLRNGAVWNLGEAVCTSSSTAAPLLPDKLILLLLPGHPSTQWTT